MASHNVVFPDRIAEGAVGGPGFSTHHSILDSGAKQKVQRWAGAGIRRYDVGYGIQNDDDAYEVLNFFIARQGSTHGFKFKDHRDFSTADDGKSAPAGDDVRLGIGDGSNKEFQMKKVYSSGGTNVNRTLTRVDSSSLIVHVNGSATTAYSLSDTGLITLDVAAPSGHNVEAGCEFWVPCSMAPETDERLQMMLVDPNHTTISGIIIEEDVEDVSVSEEFYFGGASYYGDMASNLDLTYADGFTRIFNQDTTSGVYVDLPAKADAEPGGPHFFLRNEGNVALEVRDSDTSTVIVTIDGNGSVEWALIFLGYDSGGSKKWYTMEGA